MSCSPTSTPRGPTCGSPGSTSWRRPPGIPDAVTWLTSDGGAALPDALTDLDDVLVVAHEWLDVVPCTVARVVAPGRLGVVLVDPETGEESTGPQPAPDELAWCARHWPVDDLPVGARVEVGVARDAAWDDLCSRVRRGTLLAVDYGHTRDDRPAAGTLTAYRRGAQVTPVPDGSCDLTAHVAVDALAHDERTTQRAALLDLGTSGRLPDLALARTDPAGYLAALARSSAAAALLDPAGHGRLPVGAAAGSPEVTGGAPAWHRGAGALPDAVRTPRARPALVRGAGRVRRRRPAGRGRRHRDGHAVHRGPLPRVVGAGTQRHTERPPAVE